MKQSNREENKPKRRFSEKQYQMLLRCSEKRDMTEWNEWRKKQHYEAILLEGAILQHAHLEHANIQVANLQGANLYGANLQGADLWNANLQDANLRRTNLQDADISEANLQGADLWGAHLQGANLREANLQGADLRGANLQDENLERANLQGARLEVANLIDADFELAIVDGATVIWRCVVNKRFKNNEGTNFNGVSLDNVRIETGIKQRLQYNIRRMNWEKWYKEHPLLAWLVKPFWLMSDYGMSTVRVVGVFFLLAFLFAGVYMNCAYWRPPGIISNLVVQPEMGEAELHYFFRALVRPVYFLIVTMTTLGFGDMYANKGSIAGHVILAVQVILGYVLLGALITRFAVLFTAGGPAGKFVESGKGSDAFVNRGL